MAGFIFSSLGFANTDNFEKPTSKYIHSDKLYRFTARDPCLDY